MPINQRSVAIDIARKATLGAHRLIAAIDTLADLVRQAQLSGIDFSNPTVAGDLAADDQTKHMDSDTILALGQAINALVTALDTGTPTNRAKIVKAVGRAIRSE